jgi:hypothetical protein
LRQIHRKDAKIAKARKANTALMNADGAGQKTEIKICVDLR